MAVVLWFDSYELSELKILVITTWFPLSRRVKKGADITSCSVLRAQVEGIMRTQINKLTRRHSTKAERRFVEYLKELHIPFRTKIKVLGKEADFLIGTTVIEIDGHPQSVEKNRLLAEHGYNLVHFNNRDIPSPHIKEWLQITHGRSKSVGATPDDSKFESRASRRDEQ